LYAKGVLALFLVAARRGLTNIFNLKTSVLDLRFGP
jgi:hypothetical protein